MSRKKDPATSADVSLEEQAQIEQFLGRLHDIAARLNDAGDEQQAAAALEDIERISESAQIALVKSLARTETGDSADILSALNELSARKNVRKEARRALIRLESAKVYPKWTAPAARESLVPVSLTYPPRFWRGYASQSREEGEMYFILGWEQGFDYGEIRMLSFLVDFWERGVKDFILDTMPRRGFDERIRSMKQQLSGVELVDCTLAEGRRLLEEALAVNTWRGTSPHEEFRRSRSMINQLILNAPDAGEDSARTFINPDLEPDEVAATFIAAWSMGDFGLAYDLLARDGSLRGELDRDEWIEQRRAWANEAHPSRFELAYMREREASETASALWLPSAFFPGGRSSSRKEIETAWSLELSDTPLSGTLNEMPLATAVYKETGRHWFWTSYALAQEQGLWRVQKMTDQGANAQTLSIDELNKRIADHTSRINEIMQSFSPQEANAQELSQEVVWRTVQCIYYDDALIHHLPLDRTACGDAYTRAMSVGAIERSIVYLDRLAHRFAEQKAGALRELGVSQAALSERYSSLGMKERERKFNSLAEQSLRESLALQESAAAHGVLAEHLIRSDGDLDEATRHLLSAREMITSVDLQITIEQDLAVIATKRGRYDEALSHYRRIEQLNPETEGLWYNIASMQRALHQPEAARATLTQAIEREPRSPSPYAQLATLYMDEHQAEQAIITLERGLQAVPDSAALLALLASVYADTGDLRLAETTMKRAEQLDPNLEIVQAARAALDRAIKQQ